jgi:hypothetical protein
MAPAEPRPSQVPPHLIERINALVRTSQRMLTEIGVQGDEGPAQVVRLGHGGTPSVRSSDEVAISSPPAP